MARLFTSGFETQQILLEAVSQFTTYSGTTISTSTVRSGAASMRSQAPAGTDFTGLAYSVPAVAATSYFARAYVNFASWPTQASGLAAVLIFDGASGTSPVGAGISTTGLLSAMHGTTIVGAGTQQLALNTWYRIEVKVTYGAGGTTITAVEVLVDGVVVQSSTGLSFATTQKAVWLGMSNNAGTAGTAIWYYDDFALNDSTGAAQTGYPGSGKIVNLVPASDSARGANWLAGAGGTSALWDAVNNVPPVGVAVGSATNTSQVKNSANDTVGVYDALTGTYTAAGIGGSDTISLIQGIAAVGASAASVLVGVDALPNAGGSALGEVTTTSPGVAGAVPTNWLLGQSTVAYAPSPTRGSGAVVRVRKATGSTQSGMASYMGLVVEYVPSGAISRSVSDTSTSSDSPTRQVTVGRAIANTATASDTVSRQVTTARAIANTAAAADSPSRALAIARALTETAAATDAPTRQVTVARAVADSAPAADTPTRQIATSRQIGETASSSDSLSAGALKTRAITESAPATDSPARQVVVGRQVAETATAADAPSRSVTTSRTIIESAPADDVLSRQIVVARVGPPNANPDNAFADDGFQIARSRTSTLFRQIVVGRSSVDSAPAVDSPTQQITASRSSVDSAPASDSLSATAPPRARTLTDSAPAADTLTRQTTQTRTGSETAPAADVPTRQTIVARQISNTAPAADLVVRQISTARATAESAPAADSPTQQLALARAAAQSAPATDTPTRQVQAGRNLTESAPASASCTTSTATARSCVDSALAVDGVTRTVTIVRATVESAPAADQLTRRLTIVRTGSESAPADDLVGRVTSTGRNIVETAPAADSPRTASTVSRNIVESAPAGDLVVRQIVVLRSAADTAAADDGETHTLTLGRTVSDSAPALAVLTIDHTSGFRRTIVEFASAGDVLTWRVRRADPARLDLVARPEYSIELTARPDSSTSTGPGPGPTVTLTLRLGATVEMSARRADGLTIVAE